MGWLIENPCAINLLKQNPDKIDWYHLSRNSSTIKLLEQNLDKIDWCNLSSNPSAIELLKQNHHKISWIMLSSNPSIFEIDYQAIKYQLDPLKKELMEYCYHPSRVNLEED